MAEAVGDEAGEQREARRAQQGRGRQDADLEASRPSARR